MKTQIILPLALLFAVAACSQKAKDTNTQQRVVGGPCETCEYFDVGMPASLHPQTSIGAAAEPGEPLVVSGVVYKRDGITPAESVIIYLYQTDNTGHYTPGTDQTEGRRHGHLRAWLKTAGDGRYQFSTIRPAPYPGKNIPAHIHPIVREPGTNAYYIDDYEFDDDPLLTADERAKRHKRGGSGIITITRNNQGTWVGERDIVLGLNIPGY